MSHNLSWRTKHLMLRPTQCHDYSWVIYSDCQNNSTWAFLWNTSSKTQYLLQWRRGSKRKTCMLLLQSLWYFYVNQCKTGGKVHCFLLLLKKDNLGKIGLQQWQCNECERKKAQYKSDPSALKSYILLNNTKNNTIVHGIKILFPHTGKYSLMWSAE